MIQFKDKIKFKKFFMTECILENLMQQSQIKKTQLLFYLNKIVNLSIYMKFNKFKIESINIKILKINA